MRFLGLNLAEVKCLKNMVGVGANVIFTNKSRKPDKHGC